MFNPSTAPSLPLPSRQRLPLRALAALSLNSDFFSLAQLPGSKIPSHLSPSLLSSLSSLYRFQGPPRVVHVVQRKSYYIKLAIVCQVFFFFERTENIAVRQNLPYYMLYILFKSELICVFSTKVLIVKIPFLPHDNYRDCDKYCDQCRQCHRIWHNG